MVHIGKNTRSRIVSKGISAGHSRNVYRGLVQVQSSAQGARNHSQCDSMLIGDAAGANTYPYIQVCPPSLWSLASLVSCISALNLPSFDSQGMFGGLACMEGFSTSLYGHHYTCIAKQKTAHKTN